MSTTTDQPSQFKHILRESIVIILSVLLALFANEWRGNVKEQQQTQVILNNIKMEMKDNERLAQKAVQYHQSVLDRIESLEPSDTLEQYLFNGFFFEDNKLAPNGIMHKGFNDIAWIVAKEERLATRIDFKQSERLYEVYNQQASVRATISKIIDLLYERTTHRRSSTVENVVLMGLLFHELVAQEEELLRRYQLVWKVLGEVEE